MIKCNTEYALKTAVELARTNIESTERWVTPDEVTEFIEAVYSFLTGDEKTGE